MNMIKTTQGSATEPLLSIENLVVTAPGSDVVVVNDISLTMEKGDVLALIGASGSGKTTLALTALGHLRPGLHHAKGRVVLNGVDMLAASLGCLRTLRGRIVAYVAQSAAAAFNPRMRLDDQVTESSLVHGTFSSTAACELAHITYTQLGLPTPESMGRRFPHQVSGGQLQRFMIAMGLQESPLLLVCDEPTSALDVTTQVEVLTALKRGIALKHSAALFVSHDLAVVAQIATRVAVMRQGKIVEIGTTEQILGSPQAAYTRELISSYRGFDATSGEDRGAGRIHGSDDSRFVDAISAPLLSVTQLDVGYGPLKQGRPAIKALTDINIQVSRGEMLAIIGESGSGKSTLARSIAGLHPPHAGTIMLDGVPLAPSALTRSVADRRKIQLVFQSADTSLNPLHTVERILGRVLDFFADKTTRGRPGRRQARITALLELVQLPSSYATRRPSEMSGGEKQRVNLARALAAEPELLICDEITSALDNVVANSILQLIDSLRRDLRLGVVFVSHDLAAVASLSDQVMVLRHGEVVEQGLTRQVLEAPTHPYTRLLKASVPELRMTWLEQAAAAHDALKRELQAHSKITAIR